MARKACDQMMKSIMGHLADANSIRRLRGSLEYRHATDCNCGAYRSDETVELSIFLPRTLGTRSVEFDLYSEDLGAVVYSGEALWREMSAGYDEYKIAINKKTIGVGLYFFAITLDTFFGIVYIIKHDGEIAFSYEMPNIGLPQLTVYKSEEREHAIVGGVIYHVFVDRFSRASVNMSRRSSDKLIGGEWKVIPEYPAYRGAPIKNNTFYGGSLYGVIDKLDHIASLGTTAIYLSPIFSSPSNHKYDTADYMTVDPGFGGEAALCSLIREAGYRNIKIILDGVFNHTGADSIYFNREGSYPSPGAYQSTESPYYPWYSFREYPDKYECWWGIDILPRINTSIRDCKRYFLGDNGVIDHYRKLGIYGWRLDVADELSDEFIEGVAHVMSKNGDYVLYGEVWEDASNKLAYGRRRRYYLGDQLDGVMNYPLRTGLLDYVIKKRTDTLRYALYEVIPNAPEQVMHMQMNLLGSHDTERILTLLGDPLQSDDNSQLVSTRLTPRERTKAIRRLKALSTVLYTLPGIPTVYYGDEAGLEGYADPFNRMPYPWGRESRELLSHYKHLGALRRENPVFGQGSFRIIALTDKFMVFIRRLGALIYITVFNNSDIPIVVNFDGICISLISGLESRDFALPAMSADVFKSTDVKTVSLTV